MTNSIKIYNDRIRFIKSNDFVDLVADSDGLRFTGTFTMASNTSYALRSNMEPPAMGRVGFNVFSAGGGSTNKIQKIPTAVDGATAIDVGNLTPTPFASNGQGFSDASSGYVSSADHPTAPHSTDLRKFPFSITSGTASTVATITSQNFGGALSTPSQGYTLGGNQPSGSINTGVKFPFASVTESTIAGNFSVARERVSSQTQSMEKGYLIGGFNPNYNSQTQPEPSQPHVNGEIISFSNDAYSTFPTSGFSISPFAPAASRAPVSMGGGSSSSNAYFSGGGNHPGNPVNLQNIRKIPFATDSLVTVSPSGLAVAMKRHTAAPTVNGVYLLGGAQTPSNIFTTNVYRIPFANESESENIATLNVPMGQFGTGHQD